MFDGLSISDLFYPVFGGVILLACVILIAIGAKASSNSTQAGQNGALPGDAQTGENDALSSAAQVGQNGTSALDAGESAMQPKVMESNEEILKKALSYRMFKKSSRKRGASAKQEQPHAATSPESEERHHAAVAPESEERPEVKRAPEEAERLEAVEQAETRKAPEMAEQSRAGSPNSAGATFASGTMTTVVTATVNTSVTWNVVPGEGGDDAE